MKTFKEKLHIGLNQEIKIKNRLINKKSNFQKIEIFDTLTYGRVLALDGVIQVTEKDEYAYSEMLVHPAMQALSQKAKKILIIGGGDGAVAEEVLKYNYVRKIDLVDIDKEVVELSKKYFKKINNNSLISKKLNLFYEDAFKFIDKSQNSYDLIIADRPDPIGAGKSLYKSNFYKKIKNIMSESSIAVFQSGKVIIAGGCKNAEPIYSVYKRFNEIISKIASEITKIDDDKIQSKKKIKEKNIFIDKSKIQNLEFYKTLVKQI